MQVLLVEDDLAWAGSVRQMLRKSGHSCVVVNMGKPAVDLAKAEAFDLIILDIMLPDLDGFEVMEQLRQAGCDLPVLVQSGLVEKNSTDDAHAFGANEVLIKPFGHVELIEAMVKALTLPEPETAPAVQEASLVPPATEATLTVPEDVLTLTPMAEDGEDGPAPEPAGETEEPPVENGPAAMPTAAPARDIRPKAMIAAEIVTDDKPLPCMILNISDGGASIRLPRHMTDHPKHFRLRLQSGKEEHCRVCWRAHDKIGVKFLSKEDLVADTRPKRKKILDTRL